MNATISLGIVAAGIFGVLLFATLASRRTAVDPQEFIVGGRDVRRAVSLAFTRR